jgi:alcohol/geraniol dehydrogenase (NADP+)
MLTFAARHGIAPQIELFPVGDIDAALDRVRQGRARYRAVLEM